MQTPEQIVGAGGASGRSIGPALLPDGLEQEIERALTLVNLEVKEAALREAGTRSPTRPDGGPRRCGEMGSPPPPHLDVQVPTRVGSIVH